MGIKGNVFSDTAVFDYKVQGYAVHRLCRDPVNRTRAYKPDLVFIEPVLFIPVLYFKMLVIGLCKAGKVEITAIAGFCMSIYDP